MVVRKKGTLVLKLLVFLLFFTSTSARADVPVQKNFKPTNYGDNRVFQRKRNKANYNYFKTIITSFPEQEKVAFFYQYVNPEVKMPQVSAASVFKRIMQLSDLEKSSSEIQAIERLNKFLSTNFKTVYLPGNVYTSYNNHIPKPFYKSELEAWIFDSVSNGNEEAVRGLLDNFNLLNSQDKQGNNLLVSAINSNNNNIARMLIYRGIYLDQVNNDGVTPLIFAARNGNSELVALLLLNGANPYYKDANGQSAYDYALFNDDQEILKLIKRNAPKNKKRRLHFKKKNSL